MTLKYELELSDLRVPLSTECLSSQRCQGEDHILAAPLLPHAPPLAVRTALWGANCCIRVGKAGCT